MKTYHSALPQNSILCSLLHEYDYVDGYSSLVNRSKKALTILEIVKAFFSSAPSWIDKLFTLRNKIVSVLGLKTPETIIDKQEILKNFKAKPGEKIGLFKVFYKTDQEIVLGENDKHLNFKVSIYFDHNTNILSMTTVVKYNNWFGKLYFFIIKPIHKIIVPNMLKATVQNIEKTTI